MAVSVAESRQWGRTPLRSACSSDSGRGSRGRVMGVRPTRARNGTSPSYDGGSTNCGFPSLPPLSRGHQGLSSVELRSPNVCGSPLSREETGSRSPRWPRRVRIRCANTLLSRPAKGAGHTYRRRAHLSEIALSATAAGQGDPNELTQPRARGARWKACLPELTAFQTPFRGRDSKSRPAGRDRAGQRWYRYGSRAAPRLPLHGSS